MTFRLDGIFIYGASGHAKVVIDVVEKENHFKIAAIIDDNEALHGGILSGYPIIGGKSSLLSSDIKYGIVSIGSNRARAAVADWLLNHGFSLVTAIHPAAIIGNGVDIGCGTVVMAGAVLNSDAKIGCNVIVNTHASIDHDCVVSDNAHIAPGSTLCGSVKVGKETFVGAGSTIIPNLTIGDYAVVGAGSTVVRDVPDRVLVTGVPARIVKSI